MDKALASSIAMAKDVVERLLAQNKKVTTAESCTAGLVADLIASVSGASGVLWGSFITYTMESKMKLVGVKEETLSKYGAVSGETAHAMAEGALEKSGCDYAVAVTGLAGPLGDGSDRPVGTICIAIAGKNGKKKDITLNLKGERNDVRREAASAAISGLLQFVSE